MTVDLRPARSGDHDAMAAFANLSATTRRVRAADLAGAAPRGLPAPVRHAGAGPAWGPGTVVTGRVG